MEFKIDLRKRIKFYGTDLWKIKRENKHFDDENWFNVFVRKFADESGLVKTSVRGTKNTFNFHRNRTKQTYFFKIVDKNKYMLAKIKYGIRNTKIISK